MHFEYRRGRLKFLKYLINGGEKRTRMYETHMFIFIDNVTEVNRTERIETQTHDSQTLTTQSECLTY